MFACWSVIWATISELTFTAQTGHTYKETENGQSRIQTQVPIVSTVLTTDKGYFHFIIITSKMRNY